MSDARELPLQRAGGEANGKAVSDARELLLQRAGGEANGRAVSMEVGALNAEYVYVCALSDVPDEGAVHVDIGDTPVAIVRSEGELHAIYDVCSHAYVPLSEGEVVDGEVECWLHGSCFDLRSGKPTGLPATKPVPVYTVRTEGDDVYVSVGS